MNHSTAADQATVEADVEGPPRLDDIARTLDDDRAGVEAIARAVVASDSARLTDWSVALLRTGRGGNPTTGGLFRITGHVEDARRRAAWSAILKVVRFPVETGWPADVPDEGIYWRREVELARSRLLERVRGLVPPRTYATAERPAASAWLWMEDLGDLERLEWSDPDYVFAARALARFHAPYLSGTAVPDLPWLNTDFTRRFHATALPCYSQLMRWARDGIPAFALLAPDDRDSLITPMHRVMTDPEPLLSALDDTPQVLSHGDANIDNMVIHRRSDGSRELVALDWQQAGPASLGCDLGQLLADARPSDPDGRARTVTAVLHAYRAELLAAGADVQAEVVELARAADAAVRQTAWAFFSLHQAVTRMDRGQSRDAVPARHVAEFARKAAASGLGDLARHALELVSGHQPASRGDAGSAGE